MQEIALKALARNCAELSDIHFALKSRGCDKRYTCKPAGLNGWPIKMDLSHQTTG